MQFLVVLSQALVYKCMIFRVESSCLDQGNTNVNSSSIAPKRSMRIIKVTNHFLHFVSLQLGPHQYIYDVVVSFVGETMV
jgi:hypothetical protein